MLLSEDRHVVDALKSILEEYPNLEYDEVCSQGRCFLKVNALKEHKYDATVARNICNELARKTGKNLITASHPPVSGGGDYDKDWSSFYIRKRKK